MKMRSAITTAAATLSLLAGCTVDGPSGPGGPGWGRGPGHGPMMGHGAGPGPMGGPGGDGSRMCTFYRDLTQGTSPDEQRAAVEAQMQSMHGGALTPEQLRARREAMERYCTDAPATR
jgi:hypothetical protein